MFTLEEKILSIIRESVEDRENEVAELQAKIVEMEFNNIIKEVGDV